jgi:hypothetical protein
MATGSSTGIPSIDQSFELHPFRAVSRRQSAGDRPRGGLDECGAGKHHRAPRRVPVARDLWRQKDLGTFDGKFTANVSANGVVLVKIRPAGNK